MIAEVGYTRKQNSSDTSTCKSGGFLNFGNLVFQKNDNDVLYFRIFFNMCYKNMIKVGFAHCFILVWSQIHKEFPVI